MGDVLLNGRRPEDRELPALERARRCELERDREQLAGLLSPEPEPGRAPRPVTDLILELGR